MLCSLPKSLLICLLLISSTIACENIQKIKYLPPIEKLGEVKEYVIVKDKCYSSIINTDKYGNMVANNFSLEDYDFCKKLLLFSYSIQDKLLLDNYIKYLHFNYRNNYTQEQSLKLKKDTLKKMQGISYATIEKAEADNFLNPYREFYSLRIPKKN